MAFYPPGRPMGDPRRLTGNEIVRILELQRPPPPPDSLIPVSAGPLDNLKSGAGAGSYGAAMERLKQLMRGQAPQDSQRLELQQILDALRPK